MYGLLKYLTNTKGIHKYCQSHHFSYYLKIGWRHSYVKKIKGTTHKNDDFNDTCELGYN